jgi:hypothetical protein
MRKERCSGAFSAVSVVVLICLLSSWTRPCRSEQAEAEAVNHFGVDRGSAINRSFLFIGGEYIEPPYVVERRGLSVYINDRLVKPGPEWPPFDWRVDEDPGEPPPDLPPLRSPPGVDPRNGYWARKLRYLVQHFDQAAAEQKMVETYRKSPFVRDVRPRGDRSSIWVVVFKDGRESNVSLGSGRTSWQNPSDEEYLAEAQRQKTRWEEKLAWGTCIFKSEGGGYMGPRRNLAVQMLEILVSDESPDAKVARLTEASAARGEEGFLGKAVEQFKATSQIRERFNHFKYHVEVVDGGGKGPKEMPDFGDWSKWVEFGPESEFSLTEPSAGGLFIDLDTERLYRPPGHLNLDDEDAVRAWAKGAGIDACVCSEGGQRGVRFFNVVSAWFGGSRKRVMKRVRETSAFELREDISGIERRNNSRDEQRRTKRLYNTSMCDEDDLPRAIMFKTSQGSTGLLQIVGFADEPAGVKVLCRRVLDGSGSEPAEPIGLICAAPRPDGGSFEWRVTRTKPSKIVHGWYWFDEQGIREHGGGGRQIDEAGAMDLMLSVSVEADELVLRRAYKRSTEVGQLTAETPDRTYCPRGAVLKASYQSSPCRLTSKVQLLWKGELIKDGRLVKTIIYGARATQEAGGELIDPRYATEALEIGRKWSGDS